MVKEKKILNSKMRDILRIIHQQGGSISANEISAKTGMSYVTVKKYLKQLATLKLIFPKK